MARFPSYFTTRHMRHFLKTFIITYLFILLATLNLCQSRILTYFYSDGPSTVGGMPKVQIKPKVKGMRAVGVKLAYRIAETTVFLFNHSWHARTTKPSKRYFLYG